jgi:hypothetical protein
MAYESPSQGRSACGLGNIELTARLWLAHQARLSRAITRQQLPRLQIGTESFHPGADTGEGLPSTGA